jgi:hypothetical protein
MAPPCFGAYVEEQEGEIRIHLRRKRKNLGDPYWVFSNFYEGFYFLKDLAQEAGLFLSSQNKEEPFISINGKSNDISFLDELFPSLPYLVVDEGRHAGERVVVLAEGNRVFGYRFIDAEEGLNDLQNEDLEVYFSEAPELEMVLRKFIAKKRFERLINLRD